jgi:uncharacterized protein DUF4192
MTNGSGPPERRPSADRLSPDRSPEGSSPDELSVRLREPRDLLGAIPYLVGYHPTQSVVAIGLRGSQLHVTLRADLPDKKSTLLATVDQVCDTFILRAVDAAFVVAYGSLLPALERIEVVPLEALRADDGRFWSYLCRDHRCCPPEGTPYDLAGSRVAAEATVAGWLVLPDRAAYESQIAPLPPAERVAMGPATRRAHERLVDLVVTALDEEAAKRAVLAAGLAALDEALAAQRDGQRLDDDTVAWLSVLVSSREIFNVAWGRIGHRDSLPVHRGVWMDVLRRAEPDLIAGPGVLFALAAWQRGEVTLARLALARVLDEEPTFAIAVVMDEALKDGVPLKSLPRRPSSTVDLPSARPRGLLRRRRSWSGRAGSRPG